MAARVSQQYLTAWYQANTSVARVSQQYLTVLQLPYAVDPCLTETNILPASQYPVPTAGGPQYSYLQKLADQYDTLSSQFATKGRDYRARSTQRIVRWLIEYDFFIVEADWETLYDHWISARGQWQGFDFRDPRSGSLYQNVHYAPDGFKMNPTPKRWSPKAEVNLIWFSASGSIAAPDADGWDSDTWDETLFGS